MLQGAIVPLVTPFTDEDEVDVASLGTLVDSVLEQGGRGLMPTALTGEGPLLTEAETLTVWDAVAERNDMRVPFVPAIISLTTRAACRMVREAETRGAAAVMVAPIVPEPYVARSDEDVVGFYADVAEATGLPIVLFNHPAVTGVDLTPATVERLTALSRVQYIKESTADTTRVHDIRRRVGDRVSVICGAPNVALESLALGCTAWITGLLNVVPRSGAQLLDAVHAAGDLALARVIYAEQILPVFDVIRSSRNPSGTIKAGVRARGIPVGVPRPPGQDLADAARVELADHLRHVPELEEAADRRLRALGVDPSPRAS